MPSHEGRMTWATQGGPKRCPQEVSEVSEKKGRKIGGRPKRCQRFRRGRGARSEADGLRRQLPLSEIRFDQGLAGEPRSPASSQSSDAHSRLKSPRIRHTSPSHLDSDLDTNSKVLRLRSGHLQIWATEVRQSKHSRTATPAGTTPEETSPAFPP